MDILPDRQQYLQLKRPGYASANTGNLGRLLLIHESVCGADASDIMLFSNKQAS